MSSDIKYMRHALELALRGLYTTHPNPRVGCVIVKNDRVIGEGFHIRTGDVHAELMALQQAGAEASGADVYISLEPCCHHGNTPPCCDALIEANVKNVFFATQDPNPLVAGSGASQLEKRGIHTECGLCKAEAEDLNAGFFSRMQRNRPWIRIKSAISLDGCTALSNNKSKWISGELSRHDAQLWRAKSHALLTGSNTVLADDPRLNVRLTADELDIDGELRQPLRVVLDTQLRTSPMARIYQHQDGKTVLATCSNDDKAVALYEAAGVDVLRLPPLEDSDDQRIPLHKLLALLASDYAINEIQVEAGAVLTGALIEERLCDELLLYIAPKLIGSQGKPFAELTDIISEMEACLKLVYQDSKMIGEDLRILARFQYDV